MPQDLKFATVGGSEVDEVSSRGEKRPQRQVGVVVVWGEGEGGWKGKEADFMWLAKYYCSTLFMRKPSDCLNGKLSTLLIGY